MFTRRIVMNIGAICMIKCHTSNENDTYNNTDISEMYGTDRYL